MALVSNTAHTISHCTTDLYGCVPLEVVICTYNRGIIGVVKCLKAPRSDVRYLVSLQYDQELDVASDQAIEKLQQRADVSVVTLFGSGLSRNRNHALDHASGELILIADDDVRFSDTAFDAIIAAFVAQDDAIAISFRISKPDGQPYKRYRTPGRYGRLGVFRVSSIELAVRRPLLKRYGVRFDERFGLKAEYPCCEEIVFAGDLFATGQPLYSHPAVIAYHAAESTGKNYSNDANCRARGALMRRVFGLFGYFALVMFAFQHRHEFVNGRTVRNFLAQGSIGFLAVNKSQRH